MSIIQYHEELGRNVRGGSYDDLQVSTYQLIVEAITAADFGEAGRLMDYFMDEALVCKNLFDQWIGDTEKYILFKGYGHERLETLKNEVNAVIDLDRARARWNRDDGWAKVTNGKAAFDELLANKSSGLLCDKLDVVKEDWRVSHDLDVDYLMGLYDGILREYGEDSIREMYEEHTIKDWFEKRYQRFDVSNHDWSDCYPLLTFLSFEAMHGHLCGKARNGDVEYQEFEDRIELEFDPCGSGGRAYRGEPIEGTGSRMQPPYGFQAIQGAHDFTWNKKGVCTYCAHCCILTEKMPAQEFGYPVRIIEPPTYPHHADAKCKYIIYKDLNDIPEHYYARIGMKKPSREQGLGSKAGPFERLRIIDKGEQ